MDDFGCSDGVCRDDNCELDWVHPAHQVKVPHVVQRHGVRRQALSARWRLQPWKAHSVEALHEATYRAVSSFEPRNFSTIASYVADDYGSCCSRSVHRRLTALRAEGRILRLDFEGLRVHAYLRAGSRLAADPDYVLEQVLTLQAGDQ